MSKFNILPKIMIDILLKKSWLSRIIKILLKDHVCTNSWDISFSYWSSRPSRNFDY